MATTLSATIPDSIGSAIDHEILRTKRTYSSIVTAALSQYLGVPVHTLFQVSTSGALVAGVFDREISVESILEHGDFGLGICSPRRGNGCTGWACIPGAGQWLRF